MRNLLAVGAALLALGAGRATAEVIDQRQEMVSAFSGYAFGTLAQGWSFSQSFVAGNDTLSGVAIRFDLQGNDPALRSPDDWLILRVIDVIGGTHSPRNPDYSVDSDGWVRASWAPRTIARGRTYFIEFDVRAGAQSPPYSLHVNTMNAYSRGRLTDIFFDVDANGDSVTTANVHTSDDRFDAVFRTFAAGAIPEPASWATLVAGFGLVGTVMRRRGARTPMIA